MTSFYVMEAEFNSKCAEAIAMYTESVNRYNIKCKEIELAQLQNKILTESVGYLYEDAEETADGEQKEAAKGFFESIVSFIKNIIDKIKAFFSGKKTDERVKNAQAAIKENPEAAQEKVEVFDLSAMTDLQKKHFEKIKPLLEKYRAGDKLTESQIKKLNKFLNDDYSKISGKKIAIPIAAALAAIGGAIMYSKASGNNLSTIVGTVRNKIDDKVDSFKNKGMISASRNKVDSIDAEKSAADNDMDEKIKSLKKQKSEIYASAKAEVNAKKTEIMKTLQSEVDALGKQDIDILDKIDESLAAIEAKLSKLRSSDAGVESNAKYASNSVVKGASKVAEGTIKYANKQKRAKLEDEKAALNEQKDKINSRKQSAERDLRTKANRQIRNETLSINADRASKAAEINKQRADLQNKNAEVQADYDKKILEEKRNRVKNNSEFKSRQEARTKNQNAINEERDNRANQFKTTTTNAANKVKNGVSQIKNKLAGNNK